jgi:hypothetical protein
MTSQVAIATIYRVEISGWDLNERFFVEMTDLAWSEEKKSVHLQHAIGQDAVVFVRLLGNLGRSNVFPVAYQAVEVSYQPEASAYEVLLVQLLPRPHAPDPPNVLLN